MRILLVGARGMLGRRLESALAAVGDVVSVARSGTSVTLDVTDSAAVDALIRGCSPSLVVNATAWTAVDRAESEPEAAHRVNAIAPGALATAAASVGADFVHVSTDFVFDGTLGRTLVESDAVNPLSVYGRTKEEGERRVRAAHPRALIVRTQWLYGPDGRHFVGTMLRLAAEGKPLRVVGDQFGAPTCTVDVAAAIVRLVRARVTGTVHCASKGEVSWHGFAEAIFRLAGVEYRVESIPTSGYPVPARRPARSSLRNRIMEVTIGDDMPMWQDALAAYLATTATSST